MTASVGRPAPARPTRTCIACRTARQKRDLVRIVRTTTGDLRLDPSGRLAGRGAYVCADGACWRAALTHGTIQRALGQAPGPELAALLAAGPGADRALGAPALTPSSEGGSRGT